MYRNEGKMAIITVDNRTIEYIERSPEEMLSRVNIYTDGAARGNPDGPGGYGVVITYIDSLGKEHRREFSGGYRKTTNNRMELMAAIAGLEQLKKPCIVDLFSDSQYLVYAFNKKWIYSWQNKNWMRNAKEPVKNVDLWKRLLAAMETHQVHFHWVKGHAGHPENERCDVLATTAADSEDLFEDIVQIE